MTLTRKWKDILDLLDVTDNDKRLKLAQYADHHAKIESSVYNTIDKINTGEHYSTLPLSLKILSKLDNFNITSNPIKVEDSIVSILLDRNEVIALKESIGIDLMPMIENVLIKEVINKYKDKNITVYLMADSIQLISEYAINKTEPPFPPRLSIKSRLKIN